MDSIFARTTSEGNFNEKRRKGRQFLYKTVHDYEIKLYQNSDSTMWHLLSIGAIRNRTTLFLPVLFGWVRVSSSVLSVRKISLAAFFAYIDPIYGIPTLYLRYFKFVLELML